jgi:hypothetical protein
LKCVLTASDFASFPGRITGYKLQTSENEVQRGIVGKLIKWAISGIP